MVDWSAWAPPGATDARLATGCFAAETATWTDEAQPLALDKIAQTATSTALRMAGAGLDVGALAPTATLGTLGPGQVVSQRLEGRGAVARSFLGFVPGRVVGCFVLCVEPERATESNRVANVPHDRATGQTCAPSVEGARATGDFQAPPAASVGLRVVLAAVHHPQSAAGALVAAGVIGAIGALLTRKKPRRR